MSEIRLGSDSFVDIEGDADFLEEAFVDGDYDNLQLDSGQGSDFNDLFDQGFDASSPNDGFVFDPHIVVYDTFIGTPTVNFDNGDPGVPHGVATAGIIESLSGYDVDERVDVPAIFTDNFIAQDIDGRLTGTSPDGLDDHYFNASLVLEPTRGTLLAESIGSALDEGATFSVAAGNEEGLTTKVDPELLTYDDFLTVTASSHDITESPTYIDPLADNDPRLPDTEWINAIAPGTLKPLIRGENISLDGGLTFLDQSDLSPSDYTDFSGVRADEVTVPPGEVELIVGEESAGEERGTNPDVVGRVIPFGQVADGLVEREKFEGYIADRHDLDPSTIDGGNHYVDAQALSENRLVVYEADAQNNLQKVAGVERSYTSYASPRALAERILEDERRHSTGYEIYRGDAD